MPYGCRGRVLWNADAIQAFAMNVTSDPGFRRRFPDRPTLADDIVVGDARWNQNRAYCFADESRMTFPHDRTRLMEALHEITHAALPSTVRHGEEFVLGFQWMLGRWLPAAAPHFHEACRELGVKPVG